MSDNDQAAVDEIADKIDDTFADSAKWRREACARAILDAIRKGTVPGVIFDHGAVAALMRAAARLENGIAETERADKATAERDRLAGLLRDVRHGPGWLFIDVNTRKCIEAALAEVKHGQ